MKLDPEESPGLKLIRDDDLKWKVAALCIAVFAVVTRILVWSGSGFAGEDAYITMRYAENLAHGQGFVFNVGESVQGSTTPLGTLLVALGVALGFDAMAFSRTLGILADGGTAYFIARWLARPSYNAKWAGLWAAILWAVDRGSYEVAVSGMETPLVTLAGVIGFWAILERRSTILAVCCAIVLLLRIDTVPLVLTFGLLTLARGTRFSRFEWALFLAPILAWGLFANYYFGSPIPNSLRAKLWAYQPAFSTSLSGFQNQYGGRVGQFTVIVCLCGAFLLFLQILKGSRVESRLRFWNDDRAVLLAAFCWMVVYYGALILGRRPVFYWYLIPPRPIYWMLIVWPGLFAVRWLMRWCDRLYQAEPRFKSAAAALLLLVVATMAGYWQVGRAIPILKVQQDFNDAVTPPLAQFLAKNVRQNERVMLEPIGYIGYFSHCRVLDLIGLVSPEVEPSYRTDKPLANLVTRLKPGWLCLRPHEVAWLHAQDASLPQSRYDLVKTFSFGIEPAYLVYRSKARLGRQAR